MYTLEPLSGSVFVAQGIFSTPLGDLRKPLLLVVIHISFLYIDTLPLAYNTTIEPSFLYTITLPYPVIILFVSNSWLISALSYKFNNVYYYSYGF